MLNEKIAKLLNTQINKEFYSAYLYLHFANFYVEQGSMDLPTGIRSKRRKSAITRC